jgi:hypothetical protein
MGDLYNDKIGRLYYLIPTFIDIFNSVISALTYKKNFTTALLAENGFNPLIAQRHEEIQSKMGGIILLEDELKVMKDKELNHLDNKDLVTLEKDYKEQIGDFGAYIQRLHQEWNDRLRGIRENIQKENLVEIIIELELLNDAFKNCDPPILLKNFLEFEGIFSLCRWYWIKPDKKMPLDALTDVITAWHWAMDRPEQWDNFLVDINLKKRLHDVFSSYLVYCKSKDEPLVQILNGEIENDTFQNAIAFIQHYENYPLLPYGINPHPVKTLNYEECSSVGLWDDTQTSFYVHTDILDDEFVLWVTSFDRSEKMRRIKEEAKKTGRMLKASKDETSQGKYTWNDHGVTKVWVEQRYRNADHLRTRIVNKRLKAYEIDKRLARALNAHLNNAKGFLEQYADNENQ